VAAEGSGIPIFLKDHSPFQVGVRDRREPETLGLVVVTTSSAENGTHISRTRHIIAQQTHFFLLRTQLLIFFLFVCFCFLPAGAENKTTRIVPLAFALSVASQ
jgi:hypothetical protein